MMRSLFILLAICLARPVSAEEFVSDAFGLRAATVEDTERDRWSGYRVEAPSGKVLTETPGTVDHVLFILGPKSLVAGKDQGHAVAIILDHYGNLVADGTPVTLTIGGERIGVETTDGIADYLFQPAPKAREITAGATAGQRQSSRAMIRVVPDLGSLTPEPALVPDEVAPEGFFDIGTAPLLDRFANAADDGAAVTVRLDHGDGTHSLAVATTLQGTAHGRFLSRDIAGPAGVTTVLGANSSKTSRTLLRAPEPLGIPVVQAKALPSIASVRLTIGPFLTGEGFALTDGATVTLSAIDQDGSEHTGTGWVRDGYFTSVVPISSVSEISELHVNSPLGAMDLGLPQEVSSTLEVME